MVKRFQTSLILCIAFACTQLPAQNPPVQAQNPPEGTFSNGPESKRVFWIIPNFRTSKLPQPFTPLTTKEKFKIATQDAFDRGTFVLAAAFAGEAQLTNANKDFGQGAAAYGRYFGTSLADWVIGDYMTEAIYPTLFHQDPRYFQRGTGSTWSRLGYSIGQVIVTHGDNGKSQFNFSEIIGNSTAVAISQSYYVNNRNASDAAVKLLTQVGVDAASNVLKEFWPDIHRKFFHKSGKD